MHKFKCRSTEYELNQYLNNFSIKQNQPIAIFSNIQTSGFGQHGRNWDSRLGGIWLSAAYPIFSKSFLTDIFPISIAYKICQMLSEESIKVSIKWPNDIFYDSKKLIGFLPRVITRGDQVNYVRIGLGMNINNKTPNEGISLSRILNKKKLCESYWAAKLLKVFYEIIYCNHDKESIIAGANNYLNKNYLPKDYNFDGWLIKDIDLKGNLRIFKGQDTKVLSI